VSVTYFDTDLFEFVAKLMAHPVIREKQKTSTSKIDIISQNLNLDTFRKLFVYCSTVEPDLLHILVCLEKLT